jgi:hypothetical protein
VTPAARILAAFIGVAGIVLASAALIRETVLAAGWSMRWPLPRWWADLVGSTSWRLWLAAAVAAVLTITLLIYAFRQLGGDAGPANVEYGGDHGTARLDVAALERALRRRLEAELPGVSARSLELRRLGDGWYARLEADVPARDLAGLQTRAERLVTADLQRTASMRLLRLDLVARHVFRPVAPG